MLLKRGHERTWIIRYELDTRMVGMKPRMFSLGRSVSTLNVEDHDDVVPSPATTGRSSQRRSSMKLARHRSLKVVTEHFHQAVGKNTPTEKYISEIILRHNSPKLFSEII